MWDDTVPCIVTCRSDVETSETDAKEARKSAAAAEEKLHEVERQAQTTAASLKVQACLMLRERGIARFP